MYTGPSVFNLPLSSPPPAPSEGVGPPVQKTKTNPFLTVTRRYNMPGCAAGEIFAVVTLKMMLLLSFLASRAYARTPRKIHPRDFGFGPNYANFVIKIRISFSTGTDSEGWAPGPPLFSCFCFLPPSLSLGSAGPHTFREIKNAPPRRRCSGRRPRDSAALPEHAMVR